jgi:HlyD family secretion protein
MDWLRGVVMAIAALFGGGSDPNVFYGYVEGEYVRLAPRDGGTLAELLVARGDKVTTGQVIALLESDNETASRDDARARVAQAEAQLDNLRKGKRPAEVQAVAAQQSQAAAALKLAEAQLRRQEALKGSAAFSPERLDEVRAAYERDRARLAELNAQMTVARLAARDDEIAAAEAAVDVTRAAVRQAEWRLAQRTLLAPADALVADTLFVAGEHVGAGMPVASLLPPGNVKLRVFVPEPELARVRVGAELSVLCDSCPAGLTARVTYIAPRAEYTPPVIYSRESRAKLVYLVEARPTAGAPLNPGQPVEVSLAETRSAKR